MYRGGSFRGRRFDELGLQCEKAYEIFHFARFHSTILRICILAGRHDNSSSPCVCFSLNGRCWNILTDWLESRWVLLRARNILPAVEKGCGNKGYRLRKQWHWHVFPHREENGAHASRFGSPARLDRCIHASNEGPQAAYRSVYFPHGEYSEPLSLCSTYRPRWEGPPCGRIRTLWNPIVNAGAALVIMRSLNADIARYNLTTRLLQA